MKVLAITPTFLPNIGGIENVIFDLSVELKNNNIITDVAHISNKFKCLKVEFINGVKVYCVPLVGNQLIGFAPSLKKIAADYDLLHVHDPQLCSISVNAFLASKGKRLVLSSHGGYRHTDRLVLFKKLHEFYFKKFILKKYDSVLCVSHSDLEDYSRYFPDAIAALNGVNVNKFNSYILDESKNLNNWIYWGRLSNNKKVTDIIRMVYSCRNAGLEIKLTICGPDFDGLTLKIDQLISELGLVDIVSLVGTVNDEERRDLIIQSGIFITASEYEGFGLAIVEALASGLAVFCRDIKPLNTFVINEINGLLLDFDHPDDCINVINSFILRNENDSKNLKNRSCDSAKIYGWNERIKPYLHAYNSPSKFE